MTSPLMPCCAKTLLSLPPKVFRMQRSGLLLQRRSRNALRHRLSAASHTHGYSAFLPRPASHQSSLLPAGRFCNMFPEAPSPSRGSGFEFRLRSRSFPKRCWYRSRRRFFRCWQWYFHPRGPAEAVRLRGRPLDAVDAVLRVETGVGGFSLDFRREGNECRCRVGGCTDRAA